VRHLFPSSLCLTYFHIPWHVSSPTTGIYANRSCYTAHKFTSLSGYVRRMYLTHPVLSTIINAYLTRLAVVLPTRCPLRPQSRRPEVHLSAPVCCPVSHSRCLPRPITVPSRTPCTDYVLSNEPSTGWTCAHRGPECVFSQQCMQTAASLNHTIIFPDILAHTRARSRSDYEHPVVCMRSRFCWPRYSTALLLVHSMDE
jgi:hypothetical protein